MEILLEVVRCPRTGQRLHRDQEHLVTEDGRWSYSCVNGIPVLLPEEAVEVRK
jgi:uncharacterized protein YbaR (Trm112 family)